MKKFVRLLCILLLICTVFASCDETDDVVSDIVDEIVDATRNEISTLSAPSSVWIENGFLCWNPVEYAVRYTVSIDGKESFCEDTKLSIAEIADGDHVFAVKANGDGTAYNSSEFTEALSVKLVDGIVAREGAYSQFEDLSESYLGYGFDVIRSSVFSDKFVKLSSPIFTAEGIKNQRLLRVDSKYSNIQEIVSSSMEEFSKQWNISANVGVSDGTKKVGGSVELSAQYSNENSKTKSISYQVVSITNQQFYIVMQSDLATYRSIMTEAFKADLYSTNVDPATLFDRYGTHFITSAVMGGKINSYYMHSSETEQSLSAASAAAAAEVRAWKTKVNVETSASWREEMAKQGIDVTNTLEVLGGGDFGMLSAADVPENYAAWEKSLDTDPSLIGIKDTGSLRAVWELIDPTLDTEKIYTWKDEDGEEQSGTRSAQLQAYFYQYGVEAYNDLLEASGLPEIIVPTEITNILVNGNDAVDGEYVGYAGVANDISFTVVPGNAVGYTKSIALAGTSPYARINEQNQLVVDANLPEETLLTLTLSAGGVRTQIQVRIKPSYRVEFDARYPGDDEDIITKIDQASVAQTLTGSGFAKKPSMPSESEFKSTGWIFLGWSTDPNPLNDPQMWTFHLNIVESNMKLYGNWAEFNPTITFADNYNTNAISPVQIPFNTVFQRPADPVLAGYTFGGFYSGSDMVREFDFTKPITDDTVIYVKWLPDVTVTFYSTVAGWSKDAVKVPYNTALARPADPILSGYTFGGWFADSAFETKFDFSARLTEDITVVYVLWYRNPTVTFYSNAEGFSMESVQVAWGGTLTRPATPVLSGYTFGEWYSDHEFTTLFNFAQKITADTPIYVKWNKNPTVSFASAVPGFSMESVQIPYGTALPSLADPVVAHYEFDGWYTDAACLTPFDPEQTLTEETFKLYAKFTPVNYTVSYNSNGGSAVTAQSAPYGSDMPEPTAPTKTDCWFLGWYYDAAGQSAVNFATDKVTGNVTLYAKWTDKQTFTVSFEVNGGNALNDIYVQEGSQEVTVLPTPTRVGYTFMGWYSDEALTEGNKVTDRVFTQDTTLWAKWSVNSYTVTYADGAYTLPQGYTTSYTVESDIVIPDAQHDTYPTHYRFDGWFEDAGLSVAFVNDLLTNPRNVTLYAKLTPITYTLTYVGGTATLSGNYTKKFTIENADSVVLPTVAHGTYPAHYSLAGWYEDAAFTVAFVNDLAQNPRSVTLYPKLVAKEYTITYHFNGGTASNAGEYNESYTVEDKYITLPELTWNPAYVFAFEGWYTDAALTQGFSNDLLTNPRNVHLYAKWTDMSLTVTLEANGGIVISKTHTAYYGQAYGTLLTPIRTGHSFQGWYTAAAGGSKVESTTKVSMTGSQKLYAQWKANEIGVTFDANGGSMNVAQSTGKVIYGKAYGYLKGYEDDYDADPAELPVPTRTGYVFLGWYTSASGGTEIENTTVMNVAATHTLYAQWLCIEDQWSASSEVLITDEDDVFDFVTLSKLNVTQLINKGYNRVILKIDIEAKEVNRGYQDIWVCNVNGTQLKHEGFEHGGDGAANKTYDWHPFTFEFDISTLLSTNGEFKIEYGANGDDEDDWYLRGRTYTVTAVK